MPMNETELITAWDQHTKDEFQTRVSAFLLTLHTPKAKTL
jgi:hypothetical protein